MTMDDSPHARSRRGGDEDAPSPAEQRLLEVAHQARADASRRVQFISPANFRAFLLDEIAALEAMESEGPPRVPGDLLDEDLEGWMDEEEGFGFFHPLLSAPDYELDGPGTHQLHLTLDARRRQLRDGYRRSDFRSAFAHLSAGTRHWAVYAFRDEIPDDQYWDLVRWCWDALAARGESHYEGPMRELWEEESVWATLFSAAREPTNAVMDEAERRTLSQLERPLTVYRGFVRDGRIEGIAWTTSRSDGEWFARWAHAADPDRGRVRLVPRLAIGEVSDPGIAALFTRYDSWTVIVRSGHVDIRRVEEVDPAKPPPAMTYRGLAHAWPDEYERLGR